MTNKPLQTLRDSTLTVTIWKNQGDKGPYYTAKLSRSYKDAQDNWQETDSLIGADLIKAQRLLGQAYDRIQQAIKQDAYDHNRAEGLSDHPDNPDAKAAA